MARPSFARSLPSREKYLGRLEAMRRRGPRGALAPPMKIDRSIIVAIKVPNKKGKAGTRACLSKAAIVTETTSSGTTFTWRLLTRKK
jgi:hypothetical protein